MAQLVARSIRVAEAGGSSPLTPTSSYFFTASQTESVTGIINPYEQCLEVKVAAQVRTQFAARILIGVVLLLAVALPLQVLAAAVSHGYRGSSELVPGTLVAQSKDDQSQVVAADATMSDALIGIVVANRSANLEVASPSDELQVATSGKTTAIVSDLGGRVKAGDLIAASPIKGVGMKAVAEGKCIGVAEADAPAVGTTTTTLTSHDGSKKTVQISTVPVVLEVAYFVPPVKKTPYPIFLQKIADVIAGKPVAIIRVLLATGLLLVALAIVGFILFSGIRSTLIAVGRNPLAKAHIFRALARILGTGLVILLVACGASYLVITG